MGVLKLYGDPLLLYGWPLTLYNEPTVLELETGYYAVTSTLARLYSSSFAYSDSETVIVPATIQSFRFDYENRLIKVPARDLIEELAEYREAKVKARLRNA